MIQLWLDPPSLKGRLAARKPAGYSMQQRMKSFQQCLVLMDLWLDPTAKDSSGLPGFDRHDTAATGALPLKL